MAVNLYNKIYSSMKENVPQFKNPEDALAFYFEGAAKHLKKAAQATKDGRIEDRSNHSDKALLIFSGILSHFDQASDAEKKILKPVIDYCQVMNDLIIRMNMKNDLEMALSLPEAVKKMALHWKEKADRSFQQKRKDDSQNQDDINFPQKPSLEINASVEDKTTSPSPKTLFSEPNSLFTADFSG